MDIGVELVSAAAQRTRCVLSGACDTGSIHEWGAGEGRGPAAVTGGTVSELTACCVSPWEVRPGARVQEAVISWADVLPPGPFRTKSQGCGGDGYQR